MKLSDLLTDSATLDARAGAIEVDGRHRRQPRGQARRRVRRGAGQQGRRDWPSPAQAVAAGAVAVVGERAPATLPAGAVFVLVDECAARARAGRRAVLSAPAGGDRRRHRHQRQDLGRGLHAPDLGGARPRGREHRHHRRGDAAGARSTARSPRPIRSALHRTLSELAGEGVTHLAIEASSHGLDQHRLDGVRVAAGGLHQSQPRSSRLSSERRGLSRRQAAAVRGAGGRRRQRGDRCRSRALRRGGRGGEEARAEAHHRRAQRRRHPAGRRRDRRLRAAPDGRACRQDHSTCSCRWSARFQVENALVAAGLAIATGGEPGAVFAALAVAQGRQGPARSGRRDATARRSSSTTRTSPTRWRRRSRRCGPT